MKTKYYIEKRVKICIKRWLNQCESDSSNVWWIILDWQILLWALNFVHAQLSFLCIISLLMNLILSLTLVGIGLAFGSFCCKEFEEILDMKWVKIPSIFHIICKMFYYFWYSFQFFHLKTDIQYSPVTGLGMIKKNVFLKFNNNL